MTSSSDNFDMTKEISWLPLAMRASTSCIDPNSVYFEVKKYIKEKVPKIHIRIGKNVCEKLDFKVKDRLGVFYDPDDALHMKICKSATGIKLQPSADKYTLTLAFVYRLLPIEPRKLTIINDVFTHLNNKILQVHL